MMDLLLIHRNAGAVVNNSTKVCIKGISSIETLNSLTYCNFTGKQLYQNDGLDHIRRERESEREGEMGAAG